MVMLLIVLSLTGQIARTVLWSHGWGDWEAPWFSWATSIHRGVALMYAIPFAVKWLPVLLYAPPEAQAGPLRRALARGSTICFLGALVCTVLAHTVASIWFCLFLPLMAMSISLELYVWISALQRAGMTLRHPIVWGVLGSTFATLWFLVPPSVLCIKLLLTDVLNIDERALLTYGMETLTFSWWAAYAMTAPLLAGLAVSLVSHTTRHKHIMWWIALPMALSAFVPLFLGALMGTLGRGALIDTYATVAVRHGTILSVIGLSGLIVALPQLSRASQASLAFWVVGSTLAVCLSETWLGFNGMSLGEPDVQPQFEHMHRVAGVSHWALVAGWCVMLPLVWRGVRRGLKGHDPDMNRAGVFD